MAAAVAAAGCCLYTAGRSNTSCSCVCDAALQTTAWVQLLRRQDVQQVPGASLYVLLVPPVDSSHLVLPAPGWCSHETEKRHGGGAHNWGEEGKE